MDDFDRSSNGKPPTLAGYKFGEFQIDGVEDALYRSGEKLNINRRMFQVLLLLVERAGKIVTKEEFFEKVWADSFVEDNNLTVAITALRKALGDTAKQSKFIENLPRKGYRFTAEVHQIAPAPAISHNGHRDAPAPVSDTGSVSIFKKRKILTGVLAASLLVLLTVVVFNYRNGSPSSNSPTNVSQIDSIAVLPFVNQNPATEYLSDGLTESVINNLADLPNLRVISRNSVFQYKNKEMDIAAIGHDLNVRAVLTGRIEQREDDVVINAELTDLRNNRQLWGRQYIRKVSETYTLQQDISHEISELLRTKGKGEGIKRVKRIGTDSPEAYQLYLKGIYYWNKRDIEGNEKAAESFTQAIDKDPNYALAYVGLANAYSQGVFRFIKSDQDRKTMVLAAAQRALDIDPSLGEAHATRGLMKSFYEWNWSEAEREYKLAIELSPNYATVHHWYAELLALQGRFDESFIEYGRALELDPLSLAIRTDLGITYYYAGQYDRSIEYLENLKQMSPDYWRIYWNLAEVYRDREMYEESIEEYGVYRRLMINEGLDAAEKTTELRKAYEIQGRAGFCRKMSEFISSSLTQQAMLSARLGERDRAFNLLEKACKDREESLVYINVKHDFDTIRSDPRFVDLTRCVGLKP